MTYPQQPDGYGQQSPGYGPPPGYRLQGYGLPQDFRPPPKRKTGLIIGIVVGAVLLLGGGAVAVFLLLGSGGSSGPAGDPAVTAQQYVTVVNGRDPVALRGLACTPMTEPDSQAAVAQFTRLQLQMTLAGPSGTPSGSEAYFWVDLHKGSPTPGELAEDRYLIPVRADGGRWCVSMGAMGLPG
jgi:hypothetical protein